MNTPSFRPLVLILSLAALTPPAAAKKAMPSSTPAPRPAAAGDSTATAKPSVALPLSPRSAAAAEQLTAAATGAGAILTPLPEHATLSHDFRTVPLPPRDPAFATPDDRAKKPNRTDHDFVQLRAVGDRYWLLAPGYLMVSAPNDPSSWPIVRKNPEVPPFVDVFVREQRTWLLNSEWLAEVSADGTRMLGVPHLAPRDVAVRRNLQVISGGSYRRTDPMGFTAAAVWNDQAWLANGAGAHFIHRRLLATVPLAALGGKFELHPTPEGLVAFGHALGEEETSVRRTVDGKAWTVRRPTYDVSRGSDARLAYGGGRFVYANSAAVRYSADGVVWQELPALVPDVEIEVKGRDGAYRKERRVTQWRHVTFADEFFLLLGSAFEANRRHETNNPAADQTVAAYSKDGIHWHVARLPVVPAWNWLVAGRNGRFLIARAEGNRELGELTIRWKLQSAAPGGNRHPIGFGYSRQSLQREVEEAVGRRDAQTAVRALVEMEKFYPSEATLRTSALIRAQLGDLDGAWSALTTLETLDPTDGELAVLRANVLQGAGRTAEAQAYARWFLAQKQPDWPKDPALATKAKVARFQLMSGSGQIQEAVAFAEREVLRDKTNVEFRLILAGMAMQRSDLNTARRWLNEAAALGDPRAKQMLNNLPK